MTKLFAGIDPGKTGAIAIINNKYELIKIIDCPLNKIDRKINITEFFVSLNDYLNKIKVCYFEKAQVMPHDAKTRAFTYGKTVGIFQSIVTLAGFNYIEVTPRKWKKYFGLSKDKNASIALAKEKIKNSESVLRRKKDHNRAEAILLAVYALEMWKQNKYKLPFK